FAARALRNQAPGAVNSRGMKLHEFHILQRKPCTEHHGVAVASASMRRGAREICPSIAASCQNDELGAKAVNGPILELEANNAAAAAVLHDEIDGEELDEKFRIETQRLTVERVQHRMACAVGRSACALCRRALAELRRHAPERALVNPAI